MGKSAETIERPLPPKERSGCSVVACSAAAIGQAKAEILPFRIVVIIVGIVVEVLGYPELLAIFIDDSIDTLALVMCDVFCLWGHRGRPLLSVGDASQGVAWNMPTPAISLTQ